MFAGQTWGSGIELVGAILLSAAWKSAVLLALAGGVTRLLSRRSAALRHGIWTAALAGALIIPGLEFILPAWDVPVPSAISSLLAAPQSLERPATNPEPAAPRPNGSIVAMREGPELERT